MRVEWFPLGMGWMLERAHVCCCEIIFYNRGNSSKNNETYLIFDMLCCAMTSDVTSYISCHMHSIPTSHVISQWAVKSLTLKYSD